MLDMITIEEVHSLRISEEYMKDWVSAVREEKGLDIKKPIGVFVDTWSKLMSDAEAAGYYHVGDHMKPEAIKKAKGIKEGSNLGHASFAADWCRRLTSWLPENNVILCLGEHQNEHLDMAGTPSYIPKSYTEKRNKAKIGGRAFNQNAALQLIMTRAGEYKYPDKKRSGTKVNLRVDKNSYGPGGREMHFEHRDEHRADTQNFIEEAFLFDQALCDLLMNYKLLGIKATDGAYTSDALGIISATPREVYQAFMSKPELAQELGKILKIEGYYDLYADNKDEPEADPEHAESPVEGAPAES